MVRTMVLPLPLPKRNKKKITGRYIHTYLSIGSLRLQLNSAKKLGPEAMASTPQSFTCFK